MNTPSPDPARVDELREGLIGELRELKALRSTAVEDAIRAVPRHLFVPEDSLEKAYAAERALVTKRDERGVSLSSVSAARIQAFMLEQADIRPGMRVLEIGSGGYNAALIAELVGAEGQVTTIDIDPDVIDRARRLLPAAGYGHVNALVAARPRLWKIHDFRDQTWEYRGELYDYVAARPIGSSPALTVEPDLPSGWWAAVRAVLGDIVTVRTDRYTTEQQYLDWAMPKFLGTTLDTRVPAWTTAHGDLHWANLCAPDLQILDWEGWGLAPAGYDVALLHSYSLLAPHSAARIRTEFARLLDTPVGRFAELVTITELLQSTTHGDNLPLAGPLRRRAEHLLRDAEKPASTFYAAR